MPASAYSANSRTRSTRRVPSDSTSTVSRTSAAASRGGFRAGRRTSVRCRDGPAAGRHPEGVRTVSGGGGKLGVMSTEADGLFELEEPVPALDDAGDQAGTRAAAPLA